MTVSIFVRLFAFSLLLCDITNACDQCNLYHSLSSSCPSDFYDLANRTVASESECVMHCTLRQQCQVSVFLTENSTCYSLDAVKSPGVCSSGMIARLKVRHADGNATTTHETSTVATSAPQTSTSSSSPSSSGLSMLSFASRVLMWYDFKKGYNNIADPSVYAASAPVGSVRDANGVYLSGTDSSYIDVPTSGFFTNFMNGKKFSFFFQGYFATNSNNKCISSFRDGSSDTSVSFFGTRNNGGIHSMTYSVDTPSVTYKEVKSQAVMDKDDIQRVHAVGVSFNGASYDNKWYHNGTLHNTELQTNGGGPVSSKYFNNLRIGNCKGSGYGPYSGWLHCWGFVNDSLSLAQFDSLRNLCNE